jgi:hypothetical protein
MERKNRFSILMMIFSGILMLVLTVYAIGRESSYFDLRNQASGPTISITNQWLDNGVDLVINISPSDVAVTPNVWMCLTDGPMPTCPGCVACRRNEVVDVNSSGRAVYSFEDLTAGKEYFVTACGCNDASGNCDINNTQQCMTNPVQSALYEIEQAQGSWANFNDNNFCSDGSVNAAIVDANRRHFKYEILDEFGEVYVDGFYDTMAFCRRDQEKQDSFWSKLSQKAYACGLPSFSPQEGKSYTAKLFWCRDSQTQCTQLLDTRNYTAPVCSTNSTEVQIKNLSMPSGILDVEKVPITIEIKNNSLVDSGKLTVSANLGFTDCANCDYLAGKSYTVDDLSSGQTHEKRLEFASISPGLYQINVSIEVEEKNDSKTSNNSAYKVFNVYESGMTCETDCPDDQVQKPDCSCVDCMEDTNCPNGYECDLESNECVCDDDICSSSKKMNEDCSACVCIEGCSGDQWQDDNCLCHDKTCSNVCGDKQILSDDCKCRDVECVKATHCDGLQSCDTQTHTCLCDVDCGENMQVDENCEFCECAYECGDGKRQRSDCSCVDADLDLETDPEKVEVEISGQARELTSQVDEKILLSYRIGDSSDIEDEKISWYINNEEIGTGNNFQYIPQKAGEWDIELRYEGIVKDSIRLSVIKSEVESNDEDGVNWLQGATMYLVSGLFAISSIGFLIYAVRKFYHKKKGNV